VRRRRARFDARTKVYALAAGGVVLVLTVVGACGACRRGEPKANDVPSAPQAGAVAEREAAEPSPPRDLGRWARAKDGDVEDLASLAVHEGAAGLVEAAREPELRPTALRAMAYAHGWAQLPYLARVAAAADDDAARLALESVVELAARPRTSEDVEDAGELREGCAALTALGGDPKRPAARRGPALRALRMMPCPGADAPPDAGPP
jgi:hypothetical protein